MTSITITQLRATPTVDLMTTAAALGLGRTKAYDLARRDQFPCRCIRIGETYRIPTPGLLELLGLAREEPRHEPGDDLIPVIGQLQRPIMSDRRQPAPVSSKIDTQYPACQPAMRGSSVRAVSPSTYQNV